jgi:hypothetical protein
MRLQRNHFILLGALIVLAVVVAITMRPGKKVQAAPSQSGYYSGPMRNKNNPSTYTTEDGRVVPPPTGAATSSEWSTSTVTKSGAIKTN